MEGHAVKVLNVVRNAWLHLQKRQPSDSARKEQEGDASKGLPERGPGTKPKSYSGRGPQLGNGQQKKASPLSHGASVHVQSTNGPGVCLKRSRPKATQDGGGQGPSKAAAEVSAKRAGRGEGDQIVVCLIQTRLGQRPRHHACPDAGDGLDKAVCVC